MDNLQQHIDNLQVALTQISPGPWDRIGLRVYLAGERPYADAEIGVANRMPDAHLIANSPTWLQQSITLLEQQQREIQRLREALEQVANQPTQNRNYSVALERCIEIASAALSPKEEGQTEPDDGSISPSISSTRLMTEVCEDVQDDR